MLAAMNGILLAGFRTRIVVIIVQFLRNGQIGLLDAPDEFGVELPLKGLCMSHHLLGIGVFGPQISQDLGIFPVTQPKVIVHACLAMLRDGMRAAWRHRWSERGHSSANCLGGIHRSSFHNQMIAVAWRCSSSVACCTD